MLCTFLALLTVPGCGPKDDEGKSADDQLLSVQMNDGRRVTYPVSATCVVVRNGEDATLDDLVASDKLELFGQPVVKVTATEDPTAQAARRGYSS